MEQTCFFFSEEGKKSGGVKKKKKGRAVVLPAPIAKEADPKADCSPSSEREKVRGNPPGELDCAPRAY